MKYQLICYILSHAHKIKIHEIYKTCVFTLFSTLKIVSLLEMLHLYGFFLKLIQIYYATFSNVNFDKCFLKIAKRFVRYRFFK